MTTATKEQISDLRESVLEINDELESAMAEMKELKAKIEALREQKAWRVSAVKFLRAGGSITQTSHPVKE